MSDDPPPSPRELREAATKHAVADVLKRRISGKRYRKIVIARSSGISRTYLRCLLQAEKQMSLFVFLELSDALNFEDSCQFLQEVLERRRDVLTRREGSSDGSR